VADTHTALQDWIGRRESQRDTVGAWRAAALAATLDRDPAPLRDGDPLPPLWHWLYFLPAARQSSLGPDGHPARGDFLPPVALPRRMWAGSTIVFHRPLAIGEDARRDSAIADVQHKRGRSGELVFVSVRHEIHGNAGLAITETQQIVYREAATAGAPAAAAPPPQRRDARWVRAVRPDPVLLFRYSALTFNGHRIHYDRTYATVEEGYPGLVVHGPLLATLLLEGLHTATGGRTVAAFEFKARQPLFDIAPFDVAGHEQGDGQWTLWASAADGTVAMEAQATLAG
jgi:3-methylfumaryl-CoA hydratase